MSNVDHTWRERRLGSQRRYSGASAAQRLGFDRIWPGMRIWVDGRWFYVVGIPL
jgi:hypothetical protein